MEITYGNLSDRSIGGVLDWVRESELVYSNNAYWPWSRWLARRRPWLCATRSLCRRAACWGKPAAGCRRATWCRRAEAAGAGCTGSRSGRGGAGSATAAPSSAAARSSRRSGPAIHCGTASAATGSPARPRRRSRCFLPATNCVLNLTHAH